MGVKFKVFPKLISERLLSQEDKEDMKNGLLPEISLEAHIRAWMGAGSPDYANGGTLPYEQEKAVKSHSKDMALENKTTQYRNPCMNYRQHPHFSREMG